VTMTSGFFRQSALEFDVIPYFVSPYQKTSQGKDSAEPIIFPDHRGRHNQSLPVLLLRSLLALIAVRPSTLQTASPILSIKNEETLCARGRQNHRHQMDLSSQGPSVSDRSFEWAGACAIRTGENRLIPVALLFTRRKPW